MIPLHFILYQMLNSVEDFKVLDEGKPLGNGSFSTVLKCQLRSDRKVYALKLVE